MFESTLESHGSSEAPRFLRPEDVARILNIGRTSAYALLRSGELRSIQVGRLRRVPVEALQDFVDQKLQSDSDDQGAP